VQLWDRALDDHEARSKTGDEQPHGQGPADPRGKARANASLSRWLYAPVLKL